MKSNRVFPSLSVFQSVYRFNLMNVVTCVEFVLRKTKHEELLPFTVRHTLVEVANDSLELCHHVWNGYFLFVDGHLGGLKVTCLEKLTENRTT